MGNKRGIILALGLLTAVTFLPSPLAPQSAKQIPQIPGNSKSDPNSQYLRPSEVRFANTDSPLPLTAKQKQELMKEKLDRSKNDAAELAALARELREELTQPHADLRPFNVASRADKIEKLAKKIRQETKGF